MVRLVDAAWVVDAHRRCHQLVGDAVGQWLPWCVHGRSNAPLHARVLADPRWLRFHAAHHDLLDQVQRAGAEASTTGTVVEAVARCRQNPKVPRITLTTRVATAVVVEELLDAARFVEASWLLRFADHHGETTCLRATASLLDMQGTLDKTSGLPHAPCRPDDWLLLDNGARGCVVCVSDGVLSCTRLFLLTDLVTDGSSIRKNTTLVWAYVQARWFDGSDVDRYTILRTILRFICVARVTGKGMLLPTSPLFGIYHGLPQLLSLFDVEGECASSYRVASSDTPSFLRSLRAFVQIDLPHYTTGETLLLVRDAIDERSDETFAPLRDACDALLPTNNNSRKIDLSDAYFTCPLLAVVPTHLLLYGFATHPDVDEGLRRHVVLNTFVDGAATPPRPVKQLQCMKSTTCVPDPRVQPTNDVARLLRCLEHASFVPVATRWVLPSWRHAADAAAQQQPLEDCWVHRWPEFVVPDGVPADVVKYLAYTARVPRTLAPFAGV